MIHISELHIIKIFLIAFTSIVVCFPCCVIPALSDSTQLYSKSNFLPISLSLYSLETISLKKNTRCVLCSALSLICNKFPSPLNGQKVTENRISLQSSLPQLSLMRTWPFVSIRYIWAYLLVLASKDGSTSFSKL